MRFGSGRTNPVEPVPMNVGDQVRLDEPELWQVRAVSENFAALVRPVSQRDIREHAEQTWEDEHAEELTAEDGPFYTVLDWRNGVRGPCNLIGQGWGSGEYLRFECRRMLAEFESEKITVSHRNWVPLRVNEVIPA